MERIEKSLTAMTLVILAVLLYALGAAFAVGAYASAAPGSLNAAAGLLHAAQWLRFAAWVVALAAVCAAAWELVLRRAWGSAWEAAGGAAGTLLVAIGALVLAVSGAGASAAANIVTAVGVGVWALVVLSRAARRSLAEQRVAVGGQAAGGPAAVPHQATIWLAAATGLAVFALGSGLTPDVGGKGVGIAAGALEAAGVLIVFTAIAAGRVQGYLASRAVPPVLVGTAVATAAFIGAAVVAGVVFGPGVTLTGLRVGLSVTYFILLAAAVAFGVAAWTRIRELAVSPAG